MTVERVREAVPKAEGLSLSRRPCPRATPGKSRTTPARRRSVELDSFLIFPSFARDSPPESSAARARALVLRAGGRVRGG
jgi:hypothetical protein